MLRHFLKRDFQTYRVLWILVAIITLIAIASIPLFSSYIALVPLGYVYFFLSFIPIINFNFAGVRLRSQHIMSRNYLLALPINRKHLFLIIQCRLMVYLVPLLCLLFPLPFFLPIPEEFPITFSIINYGLYCLILLSGSIWWISTGISQQLFTEKINTYLTQKKRILAWIKMFGIFVVEMAMIIGIFMGIAHFGFVYDILFVMLIMILASARFYFARKGWLHQQ